MNDYRHIAAQALAKCAAYDPWFPQPNRAMVDAWSEGVEEYELSLEHVLEGVKLAYRDNGSGFRPLPHDIVQKARAVRREEDAKRGPTDEYQALCDSKAEGVPFEDALRRIRARTGQWALGKGVDA